MPIETTAGVLQNAVQALGKLANLETLPWRACYDCTKFIKRVDAEVQSFDAARNKLIQKHGKQDERGRARVDPESENWEAFAKEYDELALKPLTLDVKKIDLSKVPEDAVTGLKPADMMALEPFAEFEGNGKDAEK